MQVAECWPYVQESKYGYKRPPSPGGRGGGRGGGGGRPPYKYNDSGYDQYWSWVVDSSGISFCAPKEQNFIDIIVILPPQSTSRTEENVIFMHVVVSMVQHDDGHY